MGDENIFEYGSYKLYKDAFQENLMKNMDKYIREHNINNPQLQKDFRDAIDFISKGVGNYITHISGNGAFRDNKGYLKHDNLGHKYAANYVNLIAHKQGELGNATPKKPEGEGIVAPKKPLFDPTKNIIGIKFESDANPLGNDSSYSFWKEGTENPVEKLRAYIDTHKKELGNKYDFSGTNLTQDFYEKSLTSLYNSLADGVGDDDIKKMQLLGFKNPSAFKPEVKDPKSGQETESVQQGVLSGDSIAAIQSQGFKIGNKNWLDAIGNDTGIPLDQDPRGYNPIQSLEQQGYEEDISFTDIANVAGPLLLDITNLVSPEPITSGAAGYGSDIWNFLADDNKRENIGKHLTNIGLTTVSLLPYVGDFGTIGKIGDGIQKFLNMRGSKVIVGGILSYLAVNYGPDLANPIIESVNKAYNKEDMTLQDYANFGQLLLGLIQVARAGKLAYNNQKISSASTIQGDAARVTTKEGRHIFQGDEAKKVRELHGKDHISGELDEYLGDYGIKEYSSIEFNNNKGWFDRNIYNPETAKNTATNYSKRTQAHTKNVVGNDKMATKVNTTPDTPSTPRTTGNSRLDNLRAKVEAKLKGEKGLSDDEVKEVDLLLRRLSENAPKKSYIERLTNWGAPKPRKEYTDVKNALIEKGYNADDINELLKGFFKHGGILKASGGIKISANDLNLGAYEGWDKFFNYDEANKEYSFKDGYDANALTKWGTSHGLNITLPTKTYGSTNYTYTPYNSLYAEGATSIGLKNSNNSLRSQSLKETPSITEEIDLNKHAESRRMYNTGDAEVDNRNRRNDFINFANYYASELSKDKDKVDIVDLLEHYNNTVDAQYKFKQSDKGRTYTGRSSDANDFDVSLFNVNNRDLYRSQNTELLHGYDDATQGKNGTATMGRSVDRSNVTLTFTEDDLKPFQDQPYFNRIKDVLLNNSFTNDGSGRYYVSTPLTISKNEEVNTDANTDDREGGTDGGDREGGVNGNDLRGDQNSIEIAPTGEPMKKKRSVDFSPLISLGSYFESIRANKKILDLTNELSPLLYNPKEHKTYWESTLGKEAEKNATIAEGMSLAKRMATSDQNFNAAFVREMYNDALKRVDQLDAEIDEINKQNLARATDTNNVNIDNRWQMAMKNLENMHQVDAVKTQAKQQYLSSNYQSRKNLADEIKNYYNTKRAEKENIDNSGYAFAVNQDIYKNPQNYMSGWNTYYDDIWKKGNSGKPLTKEEQEVYDQLQNKARNVLMANLYYNTFKIDNSVNGVSPSKASSKYDVVREILNVKKGGKLSKDDAKIILEFLKESNKNYNRAMDRSARSMYNYIKLQRKK